MIVGVVGFLGSGKGTAGDILIDQHGFTRISFADAVKDAVSTIFGWPRDLLEGDTTISRNFREKKDDWWSDKFGYEVTPRYMLQLMGTEAGRDVFNSDLWIHTVSRRIDIARKTDPNVKFVIPDVRFANEIDFIRKSGGHVIRVVRGEEPEWYNMALIANKNDQHELMNIHYPNIHMSEWAWIGQHFDYLLDNNGSLVMLESDIKHMLKVFTGPKKPDTMSNVA